MDASQHPEVVGWGVDASPEARPGVPMEREPRPEPNAHWDEPERQSSDVPVLKRMDLPRLTHVFGTTCPPRGLSGLLRRGAYRIPEHRWSHWVLLLLADRLNVLEGALGLVLPRPVRLAAAGVGLTALATGAQRWRSGPRPGRARRSRRRTGWARALLAAWQAHGPEARSADA